MADQRDETSQGLAISPVVDIFREFLEYAARRSRTEIGRAAEQVKLSMELRQVRRDRKTRLEKLGREVCALVEGGEVDHPGLKRGVGKVHELDEIITTLESHDPVVSEE